MKKIIKLEKFGMGWQFTLSNGGTYRTNEEGEGLWYYCKSGSMIRENGEWVPHYEYKQTSGTSEFSLPSDRKKTQNKIYREFKQEE